MAADERNPGQEPDFSGNASRSGPDAASERPQVSGGAKVELDLDDAPFLEDDDAKPEKEAPEKSPAPAAPAAPATPGTQSPPKGENTRQSFLHRLLADKKRLALAGGAFLFLLAAGIGVNVFLGGDDAPPPVNAAPPVAATAPTAVQLPEGPPQLPATPTAKHLMRFSPFWVEQKDAEGNIRFLSLTFSIPTDNDMLFAELVGKNIVLRDALFYYLSNRPLVTLQNETTMAALKADLMTVINEHTANGKVNDIFIENFLIQ